MNNFKHHNPYIAGKALKNDDDFFGREDIIKQVRMTLESKQNNMVVLFGQRRIGKTSILNKLERSLNNPPFFVVTFDLLDKAAKPIAEVLFDLASACAKKAGFEFTNRAAFLSNPNAFHDIFLPVLYKKLGKNKELVLMFDEFDVLDETQEKLPDVAAANKFHEYIRQLNITHYNIHFVFVVGRRMEELGSKFLSTFKEAKSIRVFVLDEKDAIALIKRGENDQIIFDNDAIDRILFYTRRHPYFIQLLCQEIFNRNFPDANNDKLIITKGMVEDCLSAACENGEGAFLWIWHGLPPAERIIFSAIAENTKSGQILTDGDIANILQKQGIKMLARELNLAPSMLVEWNMLEKVGNGYRFYFEILRKWVEEKQKLDKVKGELENLSPLAESLYQTAYTYYHQNKPDLSLLRLKDALDSNPNHFKARFLNGTILYEKKEYIGAINELRQAFKLDEKEVRFLLIKAMLEYGFLLESHGDVENAEKIYDEIIQDIYENEETALERKKQILVKRGDNYKVNGEIALAFQTYATAEATRKIAELIDEISLQASQFEKREKWGDAENLYSTLASLQPYEDKWQLKLKNLKGLMNTVNKITTIIEEATQISNKGEFEPAIRLLNETVNSSAHFDLSTKTTYGLMQKIHELRKSILENEKNIEGAKSAYEKGDIYDAIEIIYKNKAIQPENQVVDDLKRKIEHTINLVKRGTESYNDGNIPAAKKLLNEALDLNPANKPVRESLNTIEKNEDYVKDAKKAFSSSNLLLAEELSRKVLSEQPSNRDSNDLMREILKIKSTYEEASRAYDQEDYESAGKLVGNVLSKVPEYNPAIELNKKINVLTLNLERAESAHSAKDYFRSQKHLEKVLEVQPSNRRARILLLNNEKDLNKLQQRNRWVPTAAIIALISSCVTLFVAIGVLTFVPSITAKLFPYPTTTSRATVSRPSSGFTPTMLASTPIVTPATTSQIPGQLFDNNRFVLLPLSGVLKTDGFPAPIKTAVENLQLTPGYHLLAGIPLEFRHEIFTQNEGYPDYPQTLVLSTNVQNPLAAYFLIQADWGYIRYTGKQIGKIELAFDNGQHYDYPLVMGLNIRDWKRGTAPEAVSDVSSTDIIYKWEGTAPGGQAGGMDLLKVPIPAEYQSTKLVSIEIIDTSLETTGEINAGVRILAASIDMAAETPGPWEYQVEQIPSTDTSLTWNLKANNVFILTGGSLHYLDYSCTGGGPQICVLVITSTKNGDFTVDNLVPGNNWIAVTNTVSPNEAVNSVTNKFWIPPNCVGGCSSAKVAVFTDGVLVNSYKLNNPNPK